MPVFFTVKICLSEFNKKSCWMTDLHESDSSLKNRAFYTMPNTRSKTRINYHNVRPIWTGNLDIKKCLDQHKIWSWISGSRNSIKISFVGKKINPFWWFQFHMPSFCKDYRPACTDLLLNKHLSLKGIKWKSIRTGTLD